MERLGSGERELVALGAALGSNCVPCAEYHIAEARKIGFSPRQLEEAVRLADGVRRTPARKVLAAALGALSRPLDAAASTPGGKAGSVAADEQEPAVAAEKPDDSLGAKGSRSDQRCCC
jgi:4-carboxymuconolactone decarboxylase